MTRESWRKVIKFGLYVGAILLMYIVGLDPEAIVQLLKLLLLV